MTYSKRRAAIRRRRIFLALTAAVLVLITASAVLIINAVLKKDKEPSVSSQIGSTKTESSAPQKKDNYDPDKKEIVNVGGTELDANFRRVLLVNNDNPLPDNYDDMVKDKLKTVDKKYRNNDYVTDVHEDMYPYVTAMVAAAQAQGVDLRVWSPFRSSATQRVLFENQVKRILSMSGTNLPERFKAIVDRFGDNPKAMQQAGIAYATDQIIDLFANGINHVHVYSMNKPEVAAAIQANLSEILNK
mgnify:CR=1 FL=1